MANIGGYYLRHLVEHLIAAGRFEQLHRLLALETTGGKPRNAWCEALTEAGDQLIYLRDLQLAWNAAETSTAGAGDIGDRLGWQSRYALIVSSLLSQATALPPRLLGLLLERHSQRWSPEWAVSQADQQPDPERRMQALASIAPFLSGEVMDRALDVAEAVSDQDIRSKAMGIVLSGTGNVRNAFDAATRLQDESARSEALIRLADHLPPDLMDRALDLATSIADLGQMSSAVIALAPHLPSDLAVGLLNESIDLLSRSLTAELERAIGAMVAALAPALPEPAVNRALGACEALHDLDLRGRVIGALVPYLPADGLGQALDQSLGLGSSNLHAFQALLPRLDEQQRARAVAELKGRLAALAERQDSQFELSNTIALIVPYIGEESLGYCITMERTIQQGTLRLWPLAALCQRVGGTRADLHGELVSVARSIVSGRRVSRTTIDLVLMLTPRMAQAERSAVLDELVSGAIRVTDFRQRAEAINALIPALSEDPMRRVLEAIRGLPPRLLASSLTLIADHASAALLDELETAAQQVEDSGLRADVLSAVAQRMTGSRRSAIADEALAAITVLDDGEDCSETLVSLAKAAARDGQAALAIADTIADPYQQCLALVTAAADLPEADGRPIARKAVDTALAAGSRTIAPILAPVAGLLPAETIDAALQTASSPSSAEPKALEVLAPYLSAAAIDETLRRLSAFTREEQRAEGIRALSSRLSGNQAGAAIGLARQLSDSVQRGATLATLAGRLDPADQQSVLSEASEVLSEGRIYGGAVPVLLRALPSALLQPFLNRIDSAMTSAADEALAITVLAPVLTAEQRVLALQIAQRLKSAAPMAQAVASLVPYLPETERQQTLTAALEAVREVADEPDKSAALGFLAPCLPENLLGPALDIAASLGIPRNLTLEQQYEGFLDGPKIGHEPSRADALAALGPFLREEQAATALRLADAMTAPLLRMNAFAGIARSPTVPAASAAIRQALGELPRINERAFAVSEWGVESVALTRLFEAIERLAPEVRDPMSDALLHAAAQQSRVTALSSIAGLSASTSLRGGPAALTAVARAICQVRRWMP